MSATSPATPFADPLAEEGAPSALSRRQGSPSPAAIERAALVVPSTEGTSGAEGIDLVRSTGLIAAIETVEIREGAQQGIVIEQDPPAGTPMVRDGVVTLRV